VKPYTKLAKNLWSFTDLDGTSHEVDTKTLIEIAYDAIRLRGPRPAGSPHPAVVIAKALGVTRRRVEQVLKQYHNTKE